VSTWFAKHFFIVKSFFFMCSCEYMVWQTYLYFKLSFHNGLLYLSL
jgi:hypothetical protein